MDISNLATETNEQDSENIVRCSCGMWVGESELAENKGSCEDCVEMYKQQAKAFAKYA